MGGVVAIAERRVWDEVASSDLHGLHILWRLDGGKIGVVSESGSIVAHSDSDVGVFNSSELEVISLVSHVGV